MYEQKKNNNTIRLFSDDTITHWGIQGQKWGVRNYQYEDGTLTPEGIERYRKESRKLDIAGNRLVKAAKVTAGVFGGLGLGALAASTVVLAKKGENYMDKALKLQIASADGLTKALLFGSSLLAAAGIAKGFAHSKAKRAEFDEKYPGNKNK